jgi:hypothetical protein
MISSTAISGFSLGGSSGDSFSDSETTLAGGSGTNFPAAFAAAFTCSKETILDEAPAFRGGTMSSSEDLGAALAVAEGFFATSGSMTGFGSATGFFGAAAFTFALRLASAIGFAFFAGEGFAALAVTLAFFTIDFIGALAAGSFEGFAPDFAGFRVLRREGGFVAAVFFGFFMTNYPCSGARWHWRLSLPFHTRNVNLIFHVVRLSLVKFTEWQPRFACDWSAKHSNFQTVLLPVTTCLPSGQSELNSDDCRASG